MDVFQLFFDLFNAVIGFLNGILDFLERILSPVFDLINRWNNLFGRIS